MRIKLRPILLSAVVALGINSNAQTLTIDANERGDVISETLYGIFFEEINHAGDGGLYAELVANRSFEKNTKNGSALEYWSRYNGSTITAITSKTTDMINSAQERCAKITTTDADQGILNSGYKGINIVNGREYKLNLFAKADEAGATMTVKLLAADKTTVLGEATIGELTTEWKKFSVNVTATGDADRGTMAITVDKASTFYLDVVSLFPPTFKNRENGMRVDMAEALADLHPAFMRFPGGCYVEGLKNTNSYDKDCHYEWKKTIGAIEERPGHFNNNWGYEVTDGMGVMEYLQFCEDLGAAPLYVTNIGIGHDWLVDVDNIDEYIQDALDFIEFCNGDETTTWGARRIALGHKEPFNLKYLEIGNENNPMSNDVTNGYYLRYKKFRKAIADKYPEIVFIGNGEWNGTAWNNAYKTDIVDEHYYNTPDFFINRYGLYDDASRTSHKRYVGEYAVTIDFGMVGNLRAALGEAVFMCGMERNSEAVAMCSYAPIYQNDDIPGWWATEMIHFNNHDLFRTPSYYIQKLFPTYLGHQNLNVTETGNTSASPIRVGVGSYLAAATYSDMKVTLADGTVLTPTYNSDGWTSNDSGTTSWTIADGSISQTDDTKTNQTNVFDTAFTSTSYTYELKATKNSGAEGFIIPFSYVDSENYCWLNVGGWGNTKTAIEQCIGGTRTVISTMTAQTITSGQEYAIKIVVDGTDVKAYIDDELICEATITTATQRMIYTAANISTDNDIIYLRIINPYDKECTVTVNIDNANLTTVSGEILSGDMNDENTWSTPTKVTPRKITDISAEENTITYTVPAYSANFINIGIDNVSDGISQRKITNENTKTSHKSGVYTLTGMRLPDEGNLSSGVYIKNGKIVVVK